MWSGSPDIPQHRFDRLALLRRQSHLRGDGIADVVALDRETRFDAGGQIIARKGFVDAPPPPLQAHGLVPAFCFAEIVEFDALAWNETGWARHPADSANQHHRRRNMRGRREHLDAVAAS